MPFDSGFFHPPKRMFKLQSDMYIICDVPSQYILGTGSGNQNLHVYHHGSKHPGWKTRGFRCPQVERHACRGRLVERTRPRPAPRSEWNFAREFVANGGVVVWIKKGACGTSGGMAIWDAVFLVGGYCNRFYLQYVHVHFHVCCFFIWFVVCSNVFRLDIEATI